MHPICRPLGIFMAAVEELSQNEIPSDVSGGGQSEFSRPTEPGAGKRKSAENLSTAVLRGTSKGSSKAAIIAIFIVLILIGAVLAAVFYYDDDHWTGLEDDADPVAKIWVSETEVIVGQTILFDASKSSDEDGDPLTFLWDFGDGTAFSEEEKPQHQYMTVGTFVVTLLVKSAHRKTDTATVQITVQPFPEPGKDHPMAVITADRIIANIGEYITFNGSLSFDPQGDPLNFLWFFDDDSRPERTEEVSHRYLLPGVYRVTLTVSDTATGHTTVVTITVRDPTPIDLPPEQLSTAPNITKNVTTAGPVTTVTFTVENNVQAELTAFSLAYTVESDGGVITSPGVSVSDTGVFGAEVTVDGDRVTFTFDILEQGSLAFGESADLVCTYTLTSGTIVDEELTIDPLPRPWIDDNYNQIADLLEIEMVNAPPGMYIELIVRLKEPLVQSDFQDFADYQGIVIENYTFINAFYGVIPAGRLLEYREFMGSNLEFMDANSEVNATLMYGTPQVRARPMVWDDYGFDGEPQITVAVLDTGVDDSHPDLSDHYKPDGASPAWKDFAGSGAGRAVGQGQGYDDDQDGRIDEETAWNSNNDNDTFANVGGAVAWAGWQPGHDETFIDDGDFNGTLDENDTRIWLGTNGVENAVNGTPLINLTGEDRTFAWHNSPIDPDGHGTHCAGIIAGDGTSSNANTVTLSVNGFFPENSDIGGGNGRRRGPGAIVYLPEGGTLSGVMRWNNPIGIATTYGSVLLHSIASNNGSATYLGVISNNQSGGLNNSDWCTSPCIFNSTTIDRTNDGDINDANERNQVLPSGVYYISFRTYKNWDPWGAGAANQQVEVNFDPIAQEDPGDGRPLVMGMAPDTSIMGVRVLNNTGSGTVRSILGGMQYVQSNASRLNIAVVSMSLGSGTLTDVFDEAVDNLVEAGVVVVAAAGNNFNKVDAAGNPAADRFVGSVGAAEKGLTVGAVSRNDLVTTYSSNGRNGLTIGASGTPLIKPDVVAPGGSVWTGDMISSDSNDADLFAPRPDNDHTLMHGTSMATPIVSGEAALLIDAVTDYDAENENEYGGADSDPWNGKDDDGDCRIDNDKAPWKFTEEEALSVKRVILMTSHEVQSGEANRTGVRNMPNLDRGGKDRQEGYGRVNADAAIQAVTEEIECCKDEGSLGSSDNKSTDKKVWAKYIELWSEAEYTFKMEGEGTGDLDIYLYNVHYDSVTTPGAVRDQFRIGEPQIVDSGTGGGSNHEFTVKLKDVSNTAPERGHYYVVVKWVSGWDNFTLNITKKTEWTVMVYMGAENFNDEAFKDINEMEVAGSDGNISIIVLVDYSSMDGLTGAEYDQENTTYAHYIRCDKKEDNITSPVCRRWEDLNMGDGNNLSEFIKNVSKCYPADKYILDIWGQGYGWKGIIKDTVYENDTIYMGELKDALAEGGKSFEIIVFDAGLMGMVEVANQVEPFTKITIGSEETMPTDGLPYDDIFEWFTNNSDESNENISRTIVSLFHVYYTNESSDPYHTLSAINVSGLAGDENFDDLIRLIDAFAVHMYGLGSLTEWGLEDYDYRFGTHSIPDDNVQMKVKGDLYSSDRYDDANYIDLRDFMEYIRDDGGIPVPYKLDAPDIVDLLIKGGNIVIAEEHGPSHPESYGLSIYFPAYQTVYENPFGKPMNNPFDDPWPSVELKAGNMSNPSPLLIYAYDYSTQWGTSPYKPWGAIPPHPLNETPNFDFREETWWDEFLHRYYKPVADAGKDQFIWTNEDFVLVPLDGSGCSDSDGKVTRWIWDLSAERDDPLGYQMLPGGDDWEGDEHDEFIDDNNVEGMGPIVLLPVGKHVITLAVWDNHRTEPVTFKDYYNTTNETHDKHLKTDQDQVVVIIVKKALDPSPPYTSGGDSTYVTPDTEIGMQDDTGGEDITITNYYRIWHDDSWTPWEEFEKPFNLSDPCLHYIEYYGEAIIDNETFIGPVFNETYRSDDFAPITELVFLGPSYDKHLGQDGAIELNSTDEQSDLCAVGVNHTMYRIWFNGAWSDWMLYEGTFSPSDEGIHHIEFYSVDHLGNTESVRNETVYVDHSAPETYKEIGDPHLYDGIWVSDTTPFSMTAFDPNLQGEGTDTPPGSGVDHIEFRIWNNGTWTEWTDYDGSFSLGGEGLTHIEFKAVDMVGNWEDVFNQTHYVDSRPPESIKLISNPSFMEGEWVSSYSRFNLTGIDGTGIGHNGTYYRIWYNGTWSEWMPYEKEFKLQGEGEHYLEFYSVDHLGNGEPVRNQTHIVDNTQPRIGEEVGEPNQEDGYYVTKETPIWYNATDISDNGEDGSGINHIYYEVWWDSDEDGTLDTMVDSGTVESNSVELYLENLGYHEIYVWTEDNLGHMSSDFSFYHEVTKN